MLQIAEGPPVPSNQRPLRMIVSSGAARNPFAVGGAVASGRGSPVKVDHTRGGKWMVQNPTNLARAVYDL